MGIGPDFAKYACVYADGTAVGQIQHQRKMLLSVSEHFCPVSSASFSSSVKLLR